MAINVKSFLALEESLTTRLLNAWTKKSASTFRKIDTALKNEEYGDAVKLVDDLDITKTVEQNEKFITLITMSAALFGASRVTKSVKKSVFSKNKKPEEVQKAVDLMKLGLIQNVNDDIRKSSLQLIANAEDEGAQKIVYKAGSAFGRAATKAAKSGINTAASLQTSRMSVWGFTIEAGALGILNYSISEQLDNRICPVCKNMHGKTYSVDIAKSYVETLLRAENPNDLKSLAPFPKQDKASLDRIAKMSPEELTASGWHIPPFHPLCRGILRKTTDIPDLTDINARAQEAADRGDSNIINALIATAAVATAAQASGV